MTVLNLHPTCPKRGLNVWAPNSRMRIALKENLPGMVHYKTAITVLRIVNTPVWMILCPRRVLPEDLNPQLKSGQGIPATHTQSNHSERSLSQHPQTSIVASQRATAVTNMQRSKTPVKASLKAAVTAVKRSRTAVEHKVAVEKIPKAVEMIAPMNVAIMEVIDTRRYQQKKPEKNYQITTSP